LLGLTQTRFAVRIGGLIKRGGGNQPAEAPATFLWDLPGKGAKSGPALVPGEMRVAL
jgi:hypothetical protein